MHNEHVPRSFSQRIRSIASWNIFQGGATYMVAPLFGSWSCRYSMKIHLFIISWAHILHMNDWNILLTLSRTLLHFEISLSWLLFHHVCCLFYRYDPILGRDKGSRLHGRWGKVERHRLAAHGSESGRCRGLMDPESWQGVWSWYLPFHRSLRAMVIRTGCTALSTSSTNVAHPRIIGWLRAYKNALSDVILQQFGSRREDLRGHLGPKQGSSKGLQTYLLEIMECVDFHRLWVHTIST